MKPKTKTILTILEQYLEANPSIRFCQALSNLNINEFSNKPSPGADNWKLRDNYNDTNEQVLIRMTSNKG